MLIKNLKTEFCTDDYAEFEIFNIKIGGEAMTGIKARIELLNQNKWLGDATTIEYTPFDMELSDSNVEDEIITARIGQEAVLFCVTDRFSTMYETESVPFEALDKERFLLMFGDDREVYEFNQDECDDIDDFTAIYADSLEDATNQLLEMTAEAREGFGEQEDADHIREMKS